MHDNILNVSNFMRWYFSNVAAELSEADLRSVPAAGSNPPIWILGHLALSFDNGLKMLGKEPLCPTGWSDHFSRGSQPNAHVYPEVTKAHLVKMVDDGCAALGKALQEADPHRLTQPHPNAMLQKSPVKSVGDAVTLMLTAHFAGHIGQLSAYRRMRGNPALF